MQRRAARHHNLGELLALSAKRCLVVDRVLVVRHVVKHRAEQVFIFFQGLRRAFNEQAIAGLQHQRGQLGEKQRLGALDLFYTHLAARLGENLRELFAGGETVFLDIELRAEDTRRRIRHGRHALG